MSDTEITFHRRWINDKEVAPTGFTFNGRTLALVDPEDPEQVGRLVVAYMSQGSVELDNERPMTVRELRMRAALREFANPTPRIEEPQGLGAVVEDESGEKWIRDKTTTTVAHWKRARGEDCSRRYRFADIHAVRMLSEGWSE